MGPMGSQSSPFPCTPLLQWEGFAEKEGLNVDQFIAGKSVRRFAVSLDVRSCDFDISVPAGATVAS